jgi:uncharacterized protein (TIGR02217 family)
VGRRADRDRDVRGGAGEGAAITAGFLFDVPVRFDIDRLDIELTSFDAAEAPAIPLIEVRE